MAVDTTSLGSLLEALRTWLADNPDGDLEEFALEHDCSVEDLSDGWNAYFNQADFSRNYNLDTAQSGAQSGAASYSPAAPPPPGSSPAEYHEYLTQEVNNYQQFTTINNIEDNSFNQNIVGSTVDQDIDIDNSDVTQGDGSVNIDESTLTDTQVNTGDEAVQQQGNGNVANTGDVTTGDGSPVAIGGDANSVGSGNDFGAGSQGAVNAAQGDDNQQANQQQDNETTVEVGDTTGGAGTGGAGGSGGDGGAGGAGDAGGFGGDGGDTGAGGGFAGDGGDSGGDGGTGGDGGSSDGGAGTGGDAGVNIDASNDQDIDFS